jgi:antirestriction protein
MINYKTEGKEMNEENKERLIQKLMKHLNIMDLNYAEKYFKEYYIGEFKTELEFSEQMTENLGYFSQAYDYLIKYFNYDLFYRDLMRENCFRIDDYYFYNQ